MNAKNHTSLPHTNTYEKQMPKKKLNTRGAVTIQTVIITAVLALAGAGVGIIDYNTIGGKTENLATTNNLLEEFNSAVVTALRSPDADLTDAIRRIRYEQISGFRTHSCAIRGSLKEVWCWGENLNGKLGGTGSINGSPVKVPGLSNILSVVAGTQFSCALLNNGAVKCWGSNFNGELGTGRTTPSSSSTPVQVLGITGTDPNTVPRNPNQIATSIAAGDKHVCAILEDKTARCWGRNDFGQLGDENTNLGFNNNAKSSTPVRVLDSAGSTTSLANIVSIAAGHVHTCAVIMGGTVKCWGRNLDGQLGDGSTTDSNIPKDTSPLGSGVQAVSVSAGFSHTCAVVTDNKAKCWGKEQDGQIGNIELHNSSNSESFGDGRVFKDLNPIKTPVQVYLRNVASNRIELNMVASISPGDNHTCSLRMINNQGQVWCWGGALYGQLGINMLGPISSAYSTTQILNDNTAGPIATAVFKNSGGTVLNNIKAVSSGGEHSCALSNDDKVWCWGRNASFRLGLPTVGDIGTISDRYIVATEVPFS